MKCFRMCVWVFSCKNREATGREAIPRVGKVCNDARTSLPRVWRTSLPLRHRWRTILPLRHSACLEDEPCGHCKYAYKVLRDPPGHFKYACNVLIFSLPSHLIISSKEWVSPQHELAAPGLLLERLGIQGAANAQREQCCLATKNTPPATGPSRRLGLRGCHSGSNAASQSSCPRLAVDTSRYLVDTG